MDVPFSNKFLMPCCVGCSSDDDYDEDEFDHVCMAEHEVEDEERPESQEIGVQADEEEIQASQPDIVWGNLGDDELPDFDWLYPDNAGDR